MTKRGKGLRRRFRRVGSKRNRTSRPAFWMMPAGRNGQVIAMKMASRRILKRRQQWRGRSGGAAESRGGKIQHLGGVVFDQERGNDVGQDPGPDEIGIPGFEPVDVQQALEPLEGDLDLPSQ